jgi:hypothetical protein
VLHFSPKAVAAIRTQKARCKADCPYSGQNR